MSGDIFRPSGDDAIAVLGVDDAAPLARVDCFADEVVIDFPSMATAVERMRHAFVDGARDLPLCARVSLSPQQASDGVRLPLEVPLRCTCRACGGRGETWSEPCARCHATGSELLRHQVHVSVPAGVADGARFRFAVAVRHDPPTRVELQVVIDAKGETRSAR